MTIKGLEPEIERILKNSRDKIRKLQENQKDIIGSLMRVTHLLMDF